MWYEMVRVQQLRWVTLQPKDHESTIAGLPNPRGQGENELRCDNSTRLCGWKRVHLDISGPTENYIFLYAHTHTFAKKRSVISFSEILLPHHGNHNLVHIMCFVLSCWPVSVAGPCEPSIFARTAFSPWNLTNNSFTTATPIGSWSQEDRRFEPNGRGRFWQQGAPKQQQEPGPKYSQDLMSWM